MADAVTHPVPSAATVPGILLGAFAGLRVAEAMALRVVDVDFMRGVITPAIQYPAEPLKTEISKTAVPIPTELSVMLNRYPNQLGSETIVAAEHGSPWRRTRSKPDSVKHGKRLKDYPRDFASTTSGTILPRS